MKRTPSKDFKDLVELVAILRKECPWDRKQTHESIKDNLIEEAYEAIEAIDASDFEELEKELGDILLHVIFHAMMADEKEKFDIENVIFTIQEKLIRRHPHVFENVEVEDEDEVAANWEQIKLKEGRESILDGIPKQLPALIRAQRMQEKAANVGFDWPDVAGVIGKLEEELLEFKETLAEGTPEDQREEFGDLLFSMVNLGRFYDLNAEDALRATNAKFDRRFRFVEQSVASSDKAMNETSLEEMDLFWNRAKAEE